MRINPLLFGIVALVVGLSGEKTPLWIGGFFPMTSDGWNVGPVAVPAVELAIEVINNSTELLPDCSLHLEWADTKGTASVSVRQLIDMVSNGPKKIFVVGPGVSRVAVHLSVAATAWNLVQISYAARSSDLENREVYPYFYRSIPSDSMLNKIRMEFLGQFGWRRVAVIYQAHDANLYLSTMEELVPELEREGYDVIMFEKLADDVISTVRKLKELDARIIIAHVFFTGGANMFCEVYRQGLYGGKYVWILPGWAGSPSNYWIRPIFTNPAYNCTPAQMVTAMNGHFSINYLSYTSDDTVVDGLTVKEFRELMLERHGSSDEYSAFAFDSMYSIAHVLHMASHDHGFNLSEFSYDNDTFSSTFVDILNKLNISGISGPIAFDEKGGRLSVSVLEQMQGDRVPRDGALRMRKAYFLPLGASIPISVLAGAGLILALVFLAVNFRFRNLKYIKLSSPTMNNVVAVGCGLGYVSVILYGLDGRLLTAEGFDVMCNLRLVVLCVAYSLAFGALFFKTWRVHRIMANKKLEKIRMKDYHLLAWILGLVALDILFISLWAAIDPLHRAVVNLNDEVDQTDPDRIYEPYIEECVCGNAAYWLGAMLVYKGLLLLFGLFLAWETRNIQVEALNDSKYIGMCVYNMTVVCIVGVPVSFLINNQYYVGNYAISCLFIVLGTTITLCFVFVPKMYAIYHDPTGEVQVRFPTAQAPTLTVGHDGTSTTATLSTAKVTPLSQLTANIALQRRLEAMVSERDIKIQQLQCELESLHQARESSHSTA